MKLQDWLAGPFSQKMQKFMQNPYMHALQVCFTIILPMIMVGSLASLVNTFRNFAPWLPDLSLINSFSFGLISIFMAFLIPYTIMESKKLQKQKMITGFASVSALIALANPQYVDGNLVINSGYVGTGGMTVAMVMGLVIGWLFSAYFKHGLFKKDSSLPSVVVVWFESLRAGHPVRRRQSRFSLLRCDKAAEPFGSAAFAVYCKPYAKNLEAVRFSLIRQ